MFIKLLLACAACQIAIGAQPPALAPGSKAPSWSLQDVKDVTYDSSRFLGRKLLIVGGDKPAQAENERWAERAIGTCGHDLATVGVADASSAPHFLRSHVRSQFQHDESSRPSARLGVPLLLDWEGSFARSFHFVPRAPNVYLVGPDGVLRFAFSGPVTEKSLNELCSAVNAPGE